LKIEESRSLCDKASAISITTTSLGLIFAPIVGGTLYDHFGFQGTTDILMITAFAQCVIYFSVVIRPLILSKMNRDGVNAKDGPPYKYTEVPKNEEEE
jgi:MFS family permease